MNLVVYSSTVVITAGSVIESTLAVCRYMFHDVTFVYTGSDNELG